MTSRSPRVKALIKILLSTPGFSGALAADAATIKHDHAVANHAGQPPAAESRPPVPQARRAVYSAVDVKKVLAGYNLPLSQIACIMGDNVPFNAALAKQLNCPLGKCLPHSLNLIVKAALKPFKGVHAGVRGAEWHHPRAGSSARHRESLKARGLNARLMAVDPNRVATVLPVVAYHCANFETISPVGRGRAGAVDYFNVGDDSDDASDGEDDSFVGAAAEATAAAAAADERRR
jgi:hypothetical protein